MAQEVPPPTPTEKPGFGAVVARVVIISAGVYLLLGVIVTLALAFFASASAGGAGLADAGIRSILVCGFWPVALYHYLAYLFSV